VTVCPPSDRSPIKVLTGPDEEQLYGDRDQRAADKARPPALVSVLVLVIIENSGHRRQTFDAAGEVELEANVVA